MRRSATLAMAATLSLASATAWADPVGRTGTGGGPDTTAKAPHTAATGQTVPNPGALGPSETGSIERRDAIEERNDAITRGICIGCSR
ncbi:MULTISPECIES: hypothetical protein [Methylobacterium]|jgi:hypothetical protein|uniref:Uncharacterized protein n=3 Tax=Methylobacterium TaxID=407 RepID=A0AAE8L5Z6_9HYPH|nr:MULTISPECIES: hypothetical protein [Methylobacterium]KOX54266.1 hypothetical protein ADL19_14530 [Streptomyces purpurogeneiscleroticus]AIQ93357.1 protein of unassigned function [Methylobacterium oryzae CBMB20]APT33642.1 hypothetical protein MCBMB27_04351 [Methylobacterium phyllosphaerae]AWV15353.1 hypothetical protein A3862_07350 [Methylobacterium sp. XJLW]MBA9061233.1 hypothetical protein [Methylobacterium fujisawaense]